LSTDLKFDIAIVGAGPAGLIAAAALANTGRSLCVIDPSHPHAAADETDRDLRSTAFLQPACQLFSEIGIWNQIKPAAHRLRALKIVDLAGTPPRFRDARQFEPKDLGLTEFGWNILNWQLREVLLSHLEKQKNVTLCWGRSLQALFTRNEFARLTLTDGSRITCKLAIAADGRSSGLRQAAGINVDITRYGQKSLAFSALHDVPHDEVSTEIYHKGGPFTMVPLGTVGARHASAIVWMNEGPRAAALLALDVPEFEAAMNLRTAHLFGPLTLASPRGMFPILSQKTQAFCAQRVAVIAEAAHVLPPIGAQGLNTSVADIAALHGLITPNNDPGSEKLLNAYAASRQNDVKMRARAIDLFNRVTRSDNPALQTLRLHALRAAYQIAPLRKGIMHAGMGPR